MAEKGALRSILMGMKGNVGFLFFAALGLIVLAGLAFPSIHPHVTAEVAGARNTCYNLKEAITIFYGEYGHYPLKVDKLDLTTASDSPLLYILLGSECDLALEYNPRKIVFFTDRPAKWSWGEYSSGLQFFDDGVGVLWDPWGNYYMVQMDTDSDNRIASPENPEQQLEETVAVWSAGPDGDFSTWKDNITTW